MSVPTEGPWTLRKAHFYEGGDGLEIIGPNGETITDNHPYTAHALQPGDFPLVAAAPDLLKALVDLDEAFCSNNNTRSERHRSRLALIAARAAVKKARGETS